MPLASQPPGQLEIATVAAHNAVLQECRSLSFRVAAEAGSARQTPPCRDHGEGDRQLFVSHASADREVAEQIALALGPAHQVFYDRETLPPGGPGR